MMRRGRGIAGRQPVGIRRFRREGTLAVWTVPQKRENRDLIGGNPSGWFGRHLGSAPRSLKACSPGGRRACPARSAPDTLLQQSE